MNITSWPTLLPARQMPAIALAAFLLTYSSFAAESATAPGKTDAAVPPANGEVKSDADGAKADDKKDDASAAKSDAKTEEKKDEAKKEEENKEYRNWFDVSVGGAVVGGDSAAFQRRYGIPAGPFGGVEDFHYEQDIGKKGIFKVDGRGIFDNHDYGLTLDVEHPDIGYVRAGYREYRTYYDASGGYFGPTHTWPKPFDDDRKLDSGDFFFEAGLTLPNKPIITFRYDHQFRDGQKDSTSWGDLTLDGYGNRKIVPAFWDINESRDIFAGDVKHTLGNTTFGLGLRYEMSSNNDSRNILRNPGEAASRHATDREKVDLDLFNVHAFSETRFNEKVLFTTGYSFTTLDTDISGYRRYGITFDPVFAQRLPVADTFDNLSGGSELRQHVANLNLMLQLTDYLVLVPALRIESEDTDSESSYEAPVAPFSSDPYDASSERGILDVTEKLELRYTRLTNWVFYTRGEWMQGSGDFSERWDNLATGGNVVQRSSDDTRFWQTYTVGANWYPLRGLNFGAQYYHKEHRNDFDHSVDSTPNAPGSFPSNVYPAFLTAQDFTTDDANFRVTWRPRNNLTLVGRYDFQYSTIDTKPDSASGLSKVQASEMTSHIIGASASWTPLQRLYLQAGLNWVWDQTETPASGFTPAVQDAKNDYWTANTSIGYALDNKTDLQLQYLYYRADNLQSNYAYGMPYGADAEEHGVTAAIIRRISPRMRVTLKYGFFDGHDETSGSHNDYQAHLVYTSLHYKF